MRNELMKNFNPHYHKAIPTEEDCKRMKAHEAHYRRKLDKILGEHFLKLFIRVVCEGGKNVSYTIT